MEGRDVTWRQAIASRLQRAAHRLDPPQREPTMVHTDTFEDIDVTDHAAMRYAQRFTRIEDEIRNEVGVALLELRCSREPPAGVAALPRNRNATLFAWSPDGTKVYALERRHADKERICVVTVLQPTT